MERVLLKLVSLPNSLEACNGKIFIFFVFLHMVFDCS